MHPLRIACPAGTPSATNASSYPPGVVSVAFCPSPPLLVPELATGAAGELDPLRAACREAVRRLLATGPDHVVVVGAGPAAGRFPPGTTGTLAGYGVPVTASLPTDHTRRGVSVAPGPAAEPVLPPALTLGAWLLARAGVPCSGVAVTAGTTVDLPDAPAFLVLGDGSARRSERAPGYVDPRAGAFDAAVEAALASGDAAGLRDLDPALGADLLASGVPAWRAVGTALAPAAPLEAELLYAEAPYGVGYFVATWQAR